MKLRMRQMGEREERGRDRPVGTTEREDRDSKRGWLPVVEAVVFGG